jgi:hypothetical protein
VTLFFGSITCTETDAALHACPVRPLKYTFPCLSIYNLAPGPERLYVVRDEGARTVQEIVLLVSVTLLPRYPYRSLICHDFSGMSEYSIQYTSPGHSSLPRHSRRITRRDVLVTICTRSFCPLVSTYSRGQRELGL